VVVACLAAPAGSLLLLENPEAHLHPQGQVALGALAALAASDGVQIIVESHSDHFLNGIRLAVRRSLLSESCTAIHFFTRDISTGDSDIESPALLADGRLSNWPDGFFDQWDKSLDELVD
jgi:predicted ATPase